MTIVLGITFLMLVAVAMLIASEEPTEAVIPLRQVDPDQTDDESAWDLNGWTSFG